VIKDTHDKLVDAIKEWDTIILKANGHDVLFSDATEEGRMVGHAAGGTTCISSESNGNIHIN